MPIIRIAFDAFKEVEKMLHYRFWDKERERSNRAAGLHASGPSIATRYCPRHHDTIAWSGPPHDQIRAYICLLCNAAACEPEIRDRGCEFDTVPDWTIKAIMDLDLERLHGLQPKIFGPASGRYADHPTNG
jgi:hypothetical protein